MRAASAGLVSLAAPEARGDAGGGDRGERGEDDA